MTRSLGGGSYSCQSLDIEAFGIWTFLSKLELGDCPLASCTDEAVDYVQEAVQVSQGRYELSISII